MTDIFFRQACALQGTVGLGYESFDSANRRDKNKIRLVNPENEQDRFRHTRCPQVQRPRYRAIAMRSDLVLLLGLESEYDCGLVETFLSTGQHSLTSLTMRTRPSARAAPVNCGESRLRKNQITTLLEQMLFDWHHVILAQTTCKLQTLRSSSCDV
jgi:hypothetical protein